jgi:hypothetical protein
VRLSFDDDPLINEGVTDSEMFHAHREVAASAYEIEQCGVSFGSVDAKPSVPCHVRGTGTALGTSVVGGDVHHLEGKTKGPQSGETINESCTLPRRLRASA